MGIRYYKKFKEDNAVAFEISKGMALETLEKYYKREALEAVLEEGKGFRLETPFSTVWTNEDGKVPMAGFYGIVG